MNLNALVPGLLALSLFAGTGEAAQIPTAAEPAIAYGADGFGIIAYKDTATADLKVAHCVDAACTSVTVATVDSVGDVGARAPVAVRPGGLPVISYEDATNGTIKLALCADALCASATTVVLEPALPAPFGTGHTSVVIGGDGRPLVAYSRRTPSSAEGAGDAQLRVVHCDDAACTATTATTLGSADRQVTARVAGDGRVVIVSWANIDGDIHTNFRHCNDLACTSATLGGSPSRDRRALQPLLIRQEHPSLAIGPDGLPVYTYSDVGFGNRNFVRCNNHACTSPTQVSLPLGASRLETALAVDAAGRPRVATTFNISVSPIGNEIGLLECTDPVCSATQHTCVAPWSSRPAMAQGGSGQLLVAAETGTRVTVQPPGTCQPTFQGGDDFSVVEGDPPAQRSLVWRVLLHPPATTPLTIAYQTAGGTAQPGSDYAATSAVLTFPPGEAQLFALVPIIPDTTFELDETVEVVLTPSAAPITRDRVLGVLVNDDPEPQPTVSVQDCAVVEGNAGLTPCAMEVRLTNASTSAVSVSYATGGGTATAGTDYVALTGTLTFAPGTTTRIVTVGVVGDTTPEADEFFSLVLSNPSNALAGDMSATGTILDDDFAALPGLELTHGASLAGDFLPGPGPTPARDDYRFAQSPFASYEAVLDAVSGDAAPGARLERIAADGVTVLDVAEAVGTGTAVSVRFANAVSLPVTNQYLRVSNASCTTACGADDTYRLRFYETTGRIARFNNSVSQITVIVLQNPTDRPVLADLHYWDAAGVELTTQSLLIPARGLAVTNTSSLTALAGRSGSVTVLHRGPYGGLVGKAVALEPSTGFSFDSPMTVRPR